MQAITLCGFLNIAGLKSYRKMWSRVKMIRNKFRVKDIDKLFKDYCNDLFSI